MAKEDPKVNKQGTADKKKHITLTNSSKDEIIRKLESGES
jgi:hypothetical protein